MGKRSLKNLCLYYLAVDENKTVLDKVFRQSSTKNMTDQIAALGILADTNSPLRARALAAFEKRWKKYPTIMDTWFLAVQARAKRPDVQKHVEKLLRHSAFDFKNPNRVSALVGAFAGNSLGFHAKDGSGYRFIADMILKIDPINPHSAAALVKSFTRWRDYDPKRQQLMQKQLKRLAAHKKLSANSFRNRNAKKPETLGSIFILPFIGAWGTLRTPSTG